MKTVANLLWTSAALVLLAPQGVHAYGYTTHSKIVQRAVDAMEGLSSATPLVPTAPPGVSQADFEDYLDAVRDAPARLERLTTGLPNGLPGEGTDILIPGAPRGEQYPFATDPINNSPPNCDFYPNDNLSDLSRFPISQFHYTPKRTADPCGLVKVIPSLSTLGPILGWHAGSIDDHVDDSVLWFKPTNAGGTAIAKKYATQGTNILIGALIAPIYCLWQLFGGDSCDADDLYALADKYNPSNLIEGLIPGFGDVRSTNYTGLWHFIHVDADRGTYNDTRGMYYPDAGPSYPGAFDLAIIASSDLVGLSLNAYASDGDDLYGDHDQRNRLGAGPWMRYSIGHLEFSPIDNLALHGWNKFLDDGASSAEGLAWPLHAIGDSSEPHHVVGTSSWGHVPMEHYVGNRLAGFFPDEPFLGQRDSQMQRVLSGGYRWWAMLQADGDIRAFIEALARETREQVRADGDWPYTDSASTLDATGLGDLAEAVLIIDGAAPFDEILDLLEQSSGAAVAFLTFAAGHAQAPAPQPFLCPPGTTFEVATSTCQLGAPSGCALSVPTCATDSDCPSPSYVCVDQCCLVRVD